MTSAVPVEEQDELGELAGTFNDMVKKIRETTHDNAQLTESLQAMNDSLQMKVSEATAEVLQKNRALAHTNELLSAAQRDAARAQRLSAIGQMAATVAHKIGTPLTALSGHIQLMAEDPTLGAESRQRLQTVEAQIERTSKIIQDMLLYARRPEPVRSPLDLNACVAECLALFQPEFERRKIALVTEWSQQVEKVEADAQQLQEVFNSLIENAFDAMPAGGTLVVRVSPHAALGAAGPSNVGRGGIHRYGLRDGRRADGADFSAIFHDEEGRTRDGAGAGDRAGNNTGARGSHQGRERAGERLTIHDHASNQRRITLMLRQSRVMVVDDDAETLALLREVVAKEGYQVETAEDAETALRQFSEWQPDLVITDIHMPGMDGLALLAAVREKAPDILVILLTAYGSLKTAVDAIKAGAFDYLSKPFVVDDIRLVVRRALEHKKLVRENRSLRDQLRERYRFDNLVGSSAGMVAVYKLVARVAETDSTVLIQGESGTGKELIARAIHANSTQEQRAVRRDRYGFVSRNAPRIRALRT